MWSGLVWINQFSYKEVLKGLLMIHMAYMPINIHWSLRCHACTTRTDWKWKVEQYSAWADSAMCLIANWDQTMYNSKYSTTDFTIFTISCLPSLHTFLKLACRWNPSWKGKYSSGKSFPVFQFCPKDGRILVGQSFYCFFSAMTSWQSPLLSWTYILI